MLAPSVVVAMGLAVGIQHAFEPDHVVAVSTQIQKSQIDQRHSKQLRDSLTKSSILGIIWGAGHTTTLVLMGFIVYLLAITIDNQIFSGFELLVGIMLMFLGFTTILNKKISFKHKHPHKHKDGTIHFDEHEHADSEHTHNHKSYVIGLIHGLAGSGSIVVLTASTLEHVEIVLIFITIFGIGSMIGMTLISGILGLPFILSNKIPNFQKIIRYCTGTFSLILGVNILFEIGILENFSGFF